MNERRTSNRHLVHLNVDLYHEEIGLVKGNIRDISSGGMFVDILDKSLLRRRFSNQYLVVKPSNMDVLFDMQCLRVEDSFLGLKFLD